ncbi:MAG: lipoprotein-releasing ABC transporter permease subunit [Colwellia sp.]
MFQPISLFIGLRYSRSKSRTGFVSFITFFSIVGILLGVASLITVVSVMNGFEGELKKNILGIVPQVIVSDKTDKENDNNQSDIFQPWSELRVDLLQQPHVLQVTPFLEIEALVQSQNSLQGVLLQGIIPEYEMNNTVSNNMVAGSLTSLSTQPYSIVLGQSLAHKLKITLGDKVRLVLPNKTLFTPMGRIPVQRLFNVTGVFNVGSQVDDAIVYLHSKYGAKLLRRKGDGIDKLRLYLDDAFNAEKVALALKSKLPNLSLTTWNESQGVLFSAVKMEKKMMWLMLSLIVAVAAFNIVSALVMVVIEKQGEIGILQTLGMSRAGVVKIFITQGMINGLWGVILGGIFGVLLALNLNSVLALLGVNLFGSGYSAQVLPVMLELADVITIVLSALLMSFAATLYPAYQASKIHPTEVLRNE